MSSDESDCRMGKHRSRGRERVHARAGDAYQSHLTITFVTPTPFGPVFCGPEGVSNLPNPQTPRPRPNHARIAAKLRGVGYFSAPSPGHTGARSVTHPAENTRVIRNIFI
jgi:hypothetical protein